MKEKQSLGRWFRNLLLIDLFVGLYTSWKHMFRKKFTVQYPEERIDPTDRFRGIFKFLPDVCISCEMCAKACPIDIIYIEWHPEQTPEGKRKKVLDRFDIDVKRCMFCGLCEEACPTKPLAIYLTTKTYEGATYSRDEELYFDMEKLHTYTGLPDPPAEEKPAPKAPVPAPAGPDKALEKPAPGEISGSGEGGGGKE
ncbi:MAG TPA: NADH-quinone oxidoreductase subunit I [Thermoanaerobaculia bacterium]|nr:NADH-quinone oxidoreductase subunit I [Thermoanaerobaculia bacterium]HUM29548.1 NADH-quinone oxidoreductase subunit I [Thermoanaerobaculia bacterium]HXK67931.1 NADH-quinone oxidoreductase subunit I [Thermoanaerobaculia bacterium]